MSKHVRLSHPPTGPHAAEDLGHAQNPAWWTVMVLGIVAAIVGAAAVLLTSMALGIVTAVLCLLTIVVGVVMSKMGMGNYSFHTGDTAEDKSALGYK